MKRLLFTLLSIFSITSAHAAIINTWDNENDFLTANTGLSMESFESTSSSDLPLTAGDITVTTDNTTYASFNGTNSSFGVSDGNQSVRYGANDGDSIWFTFTNDINTFGINIYNFGDIGGNPLLTFFDGLGNSIVALGAGQTGPEFWGFTSDIAISSVQFTMTGGANGDGIYFDEAYYGAASVNAVPLPAALFLFAPALFAFFGLRRKISA